MIPFHLIAALVVLVGAIVALYLGSEIASEDYIQVILIFGLTVGLLFFFVWRRILPGIVLFLAMTGLSFYTFGFNLATTETVCVAGLLLYFLYLVSMDKQTAIFRSKPLQLVRWICVAWMAYVAFRCCVTLANPESHGGGVNIIKSYFEGFAPYLMLWTYAGKPVFRPHTARFERNMILLLGAGVLLCMGLRLHQYLYAPVMTWDGDRIPPAYYIPYVWLVENIYSLRWLGPICTLVGIVFATSSGLRGPSRLLGIAALPLGIAGALVSGGRAAPFLAALYVLVVLVLRRRAVTLLFLSGGLALLVFVVNMFQDTINNELPFQVSRSLQYLMVQHNGKANADLESSSNWRGEMRTLALHEWMSTPANLVIGQGYLGFTQEEWRQLERPSYEEAKYIDLRRGVTHCLFSDLLLIYGLSGAILYYFLMATLLRFYWKVYADRSHSELIRNMGLILFILSIDYVAYATIAGSLIPIFYLWLTVLLFMLLHREENDRRDADTEEAPEALAARG